MRCVTRRMPLAPDVCLEGVAARLRGYVAADVAAVCSEAALLCASEAVAAAEAAGRVEAVGEPQFLAGLRVRGEHFEAALARLGPSVLRGLAPEVPDDVSWDAIGGLEVRGGRARPGLAELSLPWLPPCCLLALPSSLPSSLPKPTPSC